MSYLIVMFIFCENLHFTYCLGYSIQNKVNKTILNKLAPHLQGAKYFQEKT